MKMHDRLVHAVVRQQVLGDLPYAEALQAGRIGLWRAIMRFDPSRGHACSTYAWPSIVHHVWRAVKMHTRAWREEPIEGYSQWRRRARIDPAALASARSVHDALHALVTGLPERLQQLVVAHYGLDGQGSRVIYRRYGSLNPSLFYLPIRAGLLLRKPSVL